MLQGVAADHLAVIRVAGMHCHRCEVAIQKRLGRIEGVHEAEVDFNSGLASVLYDPAKVKVGDLLSAIEEAGYQATVTSP